MSELAWLMLVVEGTRIEIRVHSSPPWRLAYVLGATPRLHGLMCEPFTGRTFHEAHAKAVAYAERRYESVEHLFAWRRNRGL